MVIEILLGLDLVVIQLSLGFGILFIQLELNNKVDFCGFVIQVRINVEIVIVEGFVKFFVGIISGWDVLAGLGIWMDSFVYIGF